MKLLQIALTLLVSVALLVGCASAPPPASPPQEAFTIQLKVDKTTYRIGENIIIKVKANRECYLTLYDISTQGEVTQIFPNRYAEDNLISGGYEYWIPDKDDRFDFEITGPPGVERVRAVGTIENVNLVDRGKMDSTEVFPRIYEKSNQFDKSLSQTLNNLPSERWTEASITFQVVK